MTEDQNFRLELLQMASVLAEDGDEALDLVQRFHAYVMQGVVLKRDEEARVERVQ